MNIWCRFIGHDPDVDYHPAPGAILTCKRCGEQVQAMLGSNEPAYYWKTVDTHEKRSTQ